MITVELYDHYGLAQVRSFKDPASLLKYLNELFSSIEGLFNLGVGIRIEEIYIRIFIECVKSSRRGKIKGE